MSTDFDDDDNTGAMVQRTVPAANDPRLGGARLASPFDVLKDYRAAEAAQAAKEPQPVPATAPAPAPTMAPAREDRSHREPPAFRSDRPRRVLQAMGAQQMTVQQIADAVGMSYGDVIPVLGNMFTRGQLVRVARGHKSSGGATYVAAVPAPAGADPAPQPARVSIPAAGEISLMVLITTPHGKLTLSAEGSEARSLLDALALPSAELH